jgi:hypothetical protein
MRIVDVADLPGLETTVLGPGRRHEVSQQQINQFADATATTNGSTSTPSGPRAAHSAGPSRTGT